MPTNVNFVYELTVVGKQDGQAVINVLHYKIAPGGVTTEDDSPTYLAELLASRWTNIVLPKVSNQYQLSAVIGKEYTLATPHTPDVDHPDPWVSLTVGQMGIYTTGLPAFGELLTEALPTFVGANYRKVTGYGGRYWRGSMRLGGLVEAYTNGSNWAAGVYATLVEVGEDLAENLVSANGPFNNYSMVVFSPQSIFIDPTPEPTSPALLTRTVLSFPPNEFPTSQTSRKKRGEGA